MFSSAKHRRPKQGLLIHRRAGVLTAGTLLASSAFIPAAAASPYDGDPDPEPGVQPTGNEVESSDWDQDSWSESELDEADIDDESDGAEGANGGTGGDTAVQCQSNSLVDLASLLQDGLLGPGTLIPVGEVDDGSEAPRNVCGAESDSDAGDGGNGGDGDD